jgi:hypothetical protein
MKKMLRFKRVLRLFALLAARLLMQQTLSAQVPHTFNYQGIARDAGGNVLPARKIGVELSVLDGGPTGTVVYTETFTDTTNAFGLFAMQVGGGTVVSGSFAGINWATGNKYLQTSIDLSGGTSYTLSGTTQLLSVPYALYAQNAVVGGGWGLKGNAGTGDTAFIGTTDNTAFAVKVNDSLSGLIDPVLFNTFWGYEAGNPTMAGDNNVALGYQALHLGSSGNNNVAIGYTSMGFDSIGEDNTAVGYRTLLVSNGGSNTAIGYQALWQNTSGNSNTAVGASALQNVKSGSNNTAVGIDALLTNSTGFDNTAIGWGADVSDESLTNATAIGYQATVDASNKVRIGNTAVTVIEGQVPFTTPSDGRFKFNIREDVKGLDFVLKLRPVTYQFNTKMQDNFMRGVMSEGTPVAYDEAMMVRRTGFIAQEVEKAAKMTGYNFDGLKIPRNKKEYYSLSYASFVVPLVKAVQEQEGVIRQQEQRIDDLSKQVEELRKMIPAVTQK